jgi:hypothetical protein
MGEGKENLIYSSPWTSRVLLHAVKSYEMGPPALLTSETNAVDFDRPYKSIALVGFESATFVFSGKNTNHYTTKATGTHFTLPSVA